MGDVDGLRARAGRGDVEAMVRLAALLEDGLTGYGDEEALEDEVESWLRRAAGRGDVRGMGELGLFLWHVRNDEQEALPWLLRAAEAGDVPAMGALGDVYDFLGEKDDARRWYGAAAGLGDDDAARNLSALNWLDR